MTTTWRPMRRAAAPPRARPFWKQYARDTQRPLYCLLFLFPLVATYELGALILRPAVWPDRQLVAHSLIQKLLGWFGASGFWVPAVVLLATLLLWHVLAGHPWRIRWWVLPLMVAESVALTVPLFVLGHALLRAGPGSPAGVLQQEIVLALGAGIYEELVFRFYLILGLLWLLERALRVPKKAARPLVIVLSAGLFAICHFAPIGRELFGWKHFVLLVGAGVYLALLFRQRGLGVAAGCHVAFNLIPYVWR
jgi:membrane protease YdiL (CAAX protease family)